MAAAEHKRLQLRARPQPYESFLGFILRLTELNDCDTPTWITQEAGIGYVSRKCAAASHKPLDLSLLAQLTDVGLVDLESLRYPADVQSGSTFRRLFFGLPIPQHVIRPKHPKVCPQCLLETTYIHRVWELALVTVCPLHRCLLLDECPGCDERIVWARNKVAVCPCGYDWREYSPPSIDMSELQVTQRIHLLCGLAASDSYIGSDAVDSSSPLHRLDLESLISALVFTASQLMNTVYERGKRLVDTKGKNFASKSKNAEIHTFLCKAWSVFDNWPNNYFDFLEWRRLHTPKRRFVTGLNRDFAEYKSALYQQLSSDQLCFMRFAFEEYIATKWDGGYVAHVKRLSHAARERSKYVSKKEGAKILNIGTVGIDRLIAIGKLKAVVRESNNSRAILIERESLTPVKHELEHSLYLSQVIKLLGVSRERVLDLIECGLLIPLQGQDDGRSDWKFSGSDTKAVLADVGKRVLKKAPVGSRETISFLMALRTLRRVNVGIGQFLRMVLEDVIHPVGRSASPGLASFIFLKSQISGYTRELERIQIGETLSVPEVAKLLGIGLNNVRFLIKKGIIQTHRQAIKGRCDLRVSRGAINLFESTYVLPAKVARRLGTVSSRLTNLLIASGATPVSGPKVDGGLQYAFSKADIENVDFNLLLSSSKGEHVSRLNERKLVDVRRAADLMNIDRSDVLDLVERGILTPHRHLPLGEHSASGPFFSTYTIEKYNDRTVNYVGLVSSKIAAEMLGISVSTLNDRYVPKKLLQVTLGGGHPGKRYFRLADVKMLIKNRKNLERYCITTSEAASICKVSQNSIHHWVEDGLLHPVSWSRVDGLNHNLYLRSDVEKLKLERGAFKDKCAKEGKTTRYGRSHVNLGIAL